MNIKLPLRFDRLFYLKFNYLTLEATYYVVRVTIKSPLERFIDISFGLRDIDTSTILCLLVKIDTM